MKIFIVQCYPNKYDADPYVVDVFLSEDKAKESVETRMKSKSSYDRDEYGYEEWDVVE